MAVLNIREYQGLAVCSMMRNNESEQLLGEVAQIMQSQTTIVHRHEDFHDRCMP